MTEKWKKRLAGYAAWPLSLLVLAGLYFGAKAVSDIRFDAARASAGETELQEKDGLWNYNALGAREQQVYDVLYEAMTSRDTQTAYLAFVPTQTEFSAAFDAVLYDHPLFCDLVRENCSLISGDNAAYMTLSYLPDGEERRRVLSDFAESVTQDGRSQALSDGAFALLLNDRLTQHCQYPTEPLSAHSTAYDAAVGHADSFGYALLYTLVCREAGIDCAVINGTVQSGDSVGEHAWNVLAMDGVRGYTDVMWNDAAASISMDGADGSALPFHGYYFLSFAEMSADHIPADGTAFGDGGDTQNYYEQQGCCIAGETELQPMLTALLSEAQREQVGCVEFRLEPALGITDYALEQALTAAISAVNEAAAADTPLLRQTNRIYHASHDGGSMTVQLFYEESDELGETQ